MLNILKWLVENLPGILIGLMTSSCLWILSIYFYIQPKFERIGYERRVAEVIVVDTKNEIISKGNLSELQSKSDYNLCVDSLKRRSMPIDPCEQLLGVRKEQPKP